MQTEFNLTYALAVDFLSYLRVRVDAEHGNLNLLCLQGLEPAGPLGRVRLNANEENVYNDTIACVYVGEDNAKNCLTLLGTVDPGSYYKDMPGGEAHLTFGQHFYVKGLHYGHPALRAQNEVNRVWRDLDKSGTITEGDYVAIGQFGVNIHAGGSTRYINNWSAGCINVFGGWEGTPWKQFMGLVDTHFKYKASVGVTIWSGKDLARFVDDGWKMKPTLRLGMFNPWVGELQNALKAKGFFDGSIDSDWQGKTEKAVRAFQQANGLPVDGIVGQATWDKLLA